MATTFAMTLAYAKAQRADCAEKLEDARVASNVSGQGNNWTPQAIQALQDQLSYWQRQVVRLSTAGSRRNKHASVAVWS